MNKNSINIMVLKNFKRNFIYCFIIFLVGLQLPLNAQESKGDNTLYFVLPWTDQNPELLSDIIIANPGKHQVQLQIDAYDRNGLPIPTENIPRTLEPGDVSIIDMQQLPPDVVSLSVNTDGAIKGSTSFWTVDGKKSATMPALKTSSTELSFPSTVDSHFAYKFLALFNPNDEYVTILDIIGIDRYGQRIIQTSSLSFVPMAPKETRVVALSNIFSPDFDVATIRLIPEKPLTGFQFTYNPYEEILETIPTIEALNYSRKVVNHNANSNKSLSKSPYHSLAATPTYTLSVRKSGKGAGTVTSGDEINCGTSCKKSYSKGTPITLTATADKNSEFTGWIGGGCSGTDPDCEVTITSTKAVTAKFDLQPNLPDLAIISVTAPSKGSAGKTISVSATVVNLGESEAPEYRLEFYLSPDTVITPLKQEEQDFTQTLGGGDLKLGGCNNPVLQVKNANGCHGSLLIPAGVGGGRYYIGAYADPDDTIIEISETNNGKSTISPINITRNGL